MIPLIRYPCYCLIDAIVKEREYMLKFQANLNTVVNNVISNCENYIPHLAEWQYSDLTKR
jgi:hypothetical protein